MKRFRGWYDALYEDPYGWVLRNSGMGMLLFFVATWFAPNRYDQLLYGAGFLCTALFWLFVILGMAGW